VILRTDEGKMMALARWSKFKAISVENHARTTHSGKAGLLGNNTKAADPNVVTNISKAIGEETNQ